MKKMAKLISMLCMGLLATACAQNPPPVPFTPADLNSKVSSGDYVQKVDNFLVIFDDSESMYLDRHWESKLERAKVLTANMNNTIPNLNLQAGLRGFGPKAFALTEGSALQYGMTSYSKSGLGDTVKAITTTGGNTPMAPTFELAKNDLAKTKGDIAVIVIGDGEENIKVPATAAATALKKTFGDRLCVYTILIGDSKAGAATMQDIAKTGGCGFATDEGSLSTPSGMADFVEKVFLKKAEKVAAPAPPAPPIEERKCFTVELKVEFEFDKAVVRQQYYKTLTDFADFMRSYPDYKVNLEGHTCNLGSDAYNMKLGQRRAESVRAFILKHFKDIDPARLTAISYGEAKPLNGNSTKADREHNRRVFATFTNCKKQ